ncbi:gephyrin-like molybdotransferase receptor GlpR [Haloechinothrix sp. LS1_15]|uniref:divisome protein SepX/GlpR n=1 Tax=Haloechinothrix sp. LS1_15 TaxID=2652248 RepID=UPI0029467B21|nr:gephyrin-like molybdotransferase receptor GlpR [Haloechinothrix sp. LS1_15]MDV6014308.1 hypothetical protein [Haloechinothrix sp. LS1_15]
MPSSLMIVALAAAWLVVLVPMIARKRQEISRTGEDELAARVVRSGSVRTDDREESRMPEPAERTNRSDYHDGSDVERDADREPDVDHDRNDRAGRNDRDGASGRLARQRDVGEVEQENEPSRGASRHRPGRGGFDPEAAELAARAKYAVRQRIVLTLLVTVLITALLAGFVYTGLWWANGAAIAGLAGYLVYLRRQVRIENEIRQRRMARMGTRRPRERNTELAFGDEPDHADHERDAGEPEGLPARVRSARRPQPEVNRQPEIDRTDAEVLDIDDSDPDFHELDKPSYPAYRKAVGE